MFIQSKKINCLIWSALVTAIFGAAYVIFQYEILFGVICLSFVAIMLLHILWHRPALSDLRRQSLGKPAYKLTRSFNDMAIKQIETFGLEIECTRKKIDISIREAMRNIKTFSEYSENERVNLVRIIGKTKYFNDKLFRFDDMTSLSNVLDSLCNRIIIAGQKGLLIIDRIQLSEKTVTNMMNEFDASPDSHKAFLSNTSLQDCI